MRQFRSENEWQQLISEQKSSSKSVAAFCQKKGINPNLFYRKKQTLGNKGKLVRLPTPAPNTPMAEISIGSIAIRVAVGFTDENLIRLLKCVKEASDA